MTFQTFTGADYLRIDAANAFGLDKLDWDDRIIWFNENEHRLDSLVEKAEEPAMFYASIQAYSKAKRKEVINYPISLDATASGMQILSLLAGCEKSARLCNVVFNGKRMDAYTALYDIMMDVLGETGQIRREDVKKAVRV